MLLDLLTSNTFLIAQEIRSVLYFSQSITCFFFSPPNTASAFSRKHKPDQIVIAGFHKVGAITTKTGFGDGYVYKFDDITVSQV